MKLFDAIIQGLHKNMDLRLERQNLINTNIANAETPGYRPIDLDFKEELARLLRQDDEPIGATSGGHMGGVPSFDDVRGEVIEQAGENGADGNAVDVDRQMAELSSNAFNYRASAKLVSKKMALLKYVINESR